jgi:hypothetical protein
VPFVWVGVLVCFVPCVIDCAMMLMIIEMSAMTSVNLSAVQLSVLGSELVTNACVCAVVSASVSPVRSLLDRMFVCRGTVVPLTRFPLRFRCQHP